MGIVTLDEVGKSFWMPGNFHYYWDGQVPDMIAHQKALNERYGSSRSVRYGCAGFVSIFGAMGNAQSILETLHRGRIVGVHACIKQSTGELAAFTRAHEEGHVGLLCNQQSLLEESLEEGGIGTREFRTQPEEVKCSIVAVRAILRHNPGMEGVQMTATQENYKLKRYFHRNSRFTIQLQ
jgi:hypothetical protein